MTRSHRLGLVTFAALCALAGRAEAQSCTFSMQNIDFGTINLAANVNFDINATFQASCSGIAGRTVRVCPNFGAGSGGVAAGGNPRYMLSGTTQLRYNIYRNNARTTVWGSRFWGFAPTPPTVNVTLNGAGVGSATFVARGRIPSGQTSLPTGIYTSSFAGSHTLVAYAYSTVGNCAAIGTTNATQVPFTVTANNNSSCTVSATTLDFGNRGVLDANIDATNQITVTCSSAVPYTVSLNGGSSGASDPTQRKMSLGPTQITYGIYRDAGRSQPWGSTIGTNTVAGTGTGSAQVLTGYGRVPPQTTPAPGTYTDTIVVTVTY